jgi:hypothetical protein
VFTLTKRFDDEGAVEEAKEEHVELLESGEDSAEALEAPKRSVHSSFFSFRPPPALLPSY